MIDSDDDNKYFGGLSKKESIIIFTPIFIVICIVCIFVKCGTNKDYYKRYLKNDNYNGRIIKKFLKPYSHEEAIVTISDNENEIEIYAYKWVDLWDSCSIGDSIFKNKGELQLHLVRTKKSDTLLIEFDKNQAGIRFMKRFEKH